jgi:hypothetical protein
VVNQLPRFALEAIAFGGMVLLVLVLMAQKGDFSCALLARLSMHCIKT